MRKKDLVNNKKESLIKFLEANLNGVTHKKIKNLLKYQMIEVNGKIVTNANYMLNLSSKVAVYFEKKVIPDFNLEIIYEDKDLIVINKPNGLLSISNTKEKEITAFRMVSDYVKKYDKKTKIFVVHRLDQGTSGVLMFAKNVVLKELLQKSWNNIVKKREYIAVVEGNVNNFGTIKSYLKMNKAQIVYSTKNKEGAWYAVTHYKCLKAKNGMSLLEVNIDTGRRNQIRVHMSEAGHPIVGDKKYGSKSNPIGRLALHASKLWIVDPRNGKLLKLEAHVPREIKDIVK